MSDEAERTLCQLPHVHVFKIPPRKTADGHRASDWPKDPSWTGKLKIVAKGKTVAIFLLDANNQIFAACQASEEGAVDRTLDSGRYFVLRITNGQGKHAFIGIAFNERNDAFDFNVALSEFKGELEREEKANQMSLDAPVGPLKDMSLKDGEKIKIKINLRKKNADDDEDGDASPAKPNTTGGSLLKPPPGTSSGKVGFGTLAPPPSTGFGSLPPPSATKVTAPVSASSSSFGASDPFGSAFGSSDPFATTSPAKPASSTTSASNGNVFGFSNDPFGSSDPFASSGGFTATTTPATTSKPAAGAVTNLLDF